MNIDEMSDAEKSVVLARLCGWIKPADIYGVWVISVPHSKVWGGIQWRVNPTELPNFNLYSTRMMPTAWCVLNWAQSSENGINLGFSGKRRDYDERLDCPVSWFFENSGIETMPPADAQRAWLDKVLQLAIEAGMVHDER